MRILFLYSNLITPEKGGVQRVTSVLADAFEEAGHSVHYISFSKESLPEAIHQRQIQLPDRLTINSDTNTKFLIQTIKNLKIDTLINQDGLNPSVSQLAHHCKQAGIRLITVIHNAPMASVLNYRYSAYGRFKRLSLQWLLPLTALPPIKALMLTLYQKKYATHINAICTKSDFVVLLSEQFKEELSFLLKAPCPSNVRAIPNPTSFPPWTGDLQTKTKELLYVGRIDFSQKRVDLLLRIWSTISNDFPDWTLKIIGDGPDMTAAQNLAATWGLTRIKFTGLKDPQEDYKEAAILCMTSSFEGFPLVLVEACNFGCVPVAFNSFASATDIVDNNKSGILIAPFDINSFACTLSDLMRDEPKRQQFALAAQEKAAHFSINTITKEWLKLLSNR